MLTLTPFMPAFLLLAILSLRGIKGWLAAMAIAAFFQGAAPFVLGGSARDAGLAPAYLLLPVGVLHWVRWRLAVAGPARRMLLTPAHWALIAFTLCGVIGAVLLPRLFAQDVLVLPSRAQRYLRMEPLAPQSTNYIQGFYLVLNYMVFALTARFVSSGQATEADLRKWVVRGAVLTALIGLYQWGGSFVNAPWPSEFFNSNTGVIQLEEQATMGLRRISATFIEPSVLGYHFVGCVGLALFSGRHVRAGLLILLVLLLALASSGYVNLTLLTLAWIVLARLPMTRKLQIAGALFVLGLAALLADQILFDGRLVEGLILNKGTSESGTVRATWNRMALESFVQSWGLGTGIGSARGSSFAATLLATFGIPGAILLVTFLWLAVRAGLSDRGASGQGWGFAVLAFAIGWCVAMPDISLPLVWLCAGAAAGLQLERVRVAELRRAPIRAGAAFANVMPPDKFAPAPGQPRRRPSRPQSGGTGVEPAAGRARIAP